ncbi:hypothetical protein [Mesorhizobium shangrilense]|uniref:Uncharacterized protein n=1 Tax=Mesorhizobium shangrilense TaxID=460060 RepID=A0ABV2DSW5_9HYPH
MYFANVNAHAGDVSCKRHRFPAEVIAHTFGFRRQARRLPADRPGRVFDAYFRHQKIKTIDLNAFHPIAWETVREVFARIASFSPPCLPISDPTARL